MLVGGGLGRTPIVAETVRDFLPKRDLLSYLEAILRVYNQYGRRDNLYKSRIKILVHSLGIDKMRDEVEAEWAAMDHATLALPDDGDRRDGAVLPAARMRAARRRTMRRCADALAIRSGLRALGRSTMWRRTRSPGHAIVTVSLKEPGRTPGDCTAEQMELVADLADRYGSGEIRVTHEQNLVLPHVRRVDLPALWQRLAAAGLGDRQCRARQRHHRLPRHGLLQPGHGALDPDRAAARPRISPRASARSARLQIKISGCINACGHHHVGHIGMLGVDKNGEEFYQITLGGRADDDAAHRPDHRPRGAERRR